jgi:negative regulator of flagellin synthesis FlgM
MNPIDKPVLTGAGIRLASAAMAPVTRTEAVRSARPLATGQDDVPPMQAESAGVEPTVDTDRVTMIRRALEDGHYPVVPARIADAMIAASYLLRTK